MKRAGSVVSVTQCGMLIHVSGVFKYKCMVECVCMCSEVRQNHQSICQPLSG